MFKNLHTTDRELSALCAIAFTVEEALELTVPKPGWRQNEFNLSLHKGAFRDAVALRYGWPPLNLPSHCSCGSNFTVQHALSCPMGGFPTLRHNEERDLTADLMAEVCHDVCTEPTLQPLIMTGETLTGASAITDDGARL